MISLSATCRQLHAETALLPFTAAEFQYSFYTSTWFQKLAKHQRISVRNIRSYIIPRLPADFDHPARLMVDGEAGEGLAWLEDVTKQLKEVLPGLETWQIDRVSSRLRRDLIVRDDLVINGVLVKISARCG